MKTLIFVLFTFLSFNTFASDDFDYKRILERASYDNCRVYVRDGKIYTYNCKPEDKKRDVVRQVDREIERTVNRKIDKALSKLFR